jgi:hypothetical protein
MPQGFEVVGQADRTSLANIDIYSMISRVDRMRLEVEHCQSADLPSGLLAADAARLQDYIVDYRAFATRVKGNPIPDAPETHGHLRLPLPNDDHIGDPTKIENEDCRLLLANLVQLRTELQNCASARLPQGLMPIPDGQPGDWARISDFITRIEQLLTYVTAQEPSDRPESTPSSMPTGPGHLGT